MVAAARDLAKSAGLQGLKAEHADDLFLVTLDVTDESSAKVCLVASVSLAISLAACA